MSTEISNQVSLAMILHQEVSCWMELVSKLTCHREKVLKIPLRSLDQEPGRES